MIALELDGVFADGLFDLVTYNDGTSSSDIEAVVDYGFGGSDSAVMDQAIILVKKSQVPSPGRGDTFVIDSETWYLLENMDKEAELLKLKISRSSRIRI